jgi:hypothetical protein
MTSAPWLASRELEKGAAMTEEISTIFSPLSGPGWFIELALTMSVKDTHLLSIPEV